MALTLGFYDYTSSGVGVLGTPSGTYTGSGGIRIVLSETPQDIISNIGSSYTGNGSNKGHNNIYYILRSDASVDHGLILAGVTNITVTYTLSDD